MGCVQPEFLPGQGAELNLPKRRDPELIGYFGQNGLPFPDTIKDREIYLVSEDLNDDSQACSALPLNTPDLSNYVVLVRQSLSTCTNVEQLENLEEAGAEFILFYSALPTTPPEINPNSTIGTTTTVVAQLVLDAMQSTKLNATFTAPNETSFVGVYPEGPYSGLACPSSAWGPTYLLDIKPDIVAPGDNILSTFLDNSYAILSGAYISTPYVAGVAALYLSVNPTKSKSSAVVSQHLSLPCRVM